MKKPESQIAWLHVVGVALVYAALIFISICVSFNATFLSGFYIAYALLISSLVIFGFWAALGSGAATDRFSQGMILGNESTLLEECWFVFMVTFVACLASQVPFWILRFVLGWQLVQESRDWFEQKISIQNIFFLTAVFAIGFAMTGYAANMYFDAMVNEIQIGHDDYVETDKVDADGTPVIEYVEVTEDNIEEMQEKRKEEYEPYKAGLSIGVAIYSAIIAVVALLFAPAIWLTLRRSGTRIGVYVAALYLVAIFLAIGILNGIWMSAGLVVWGQMIVYVVGFGFALTIAAMIPLLLSRNLGIRLASARDFRERRDEEDDEAVPELVAVEY